MGKVRFEILYDLRDEDAWMQAHRDRKLWGKIYTDFYALDSDHIVLIFRPAPHERWRRWEEERRHMILGKRVVA